MASLSQLQKLANGRALEAAAVWNSRSQQCMLEASAKPHAAHKLSATCVPWAPVAPGSVRDWAACDARPNVTSVKGYSGVRLT